MLALPVSEITKCSSVERSGLAKCCVQAQSVSYLRKCHIKPHAAMLNPAELADSRLLDVTKTKQLWKD